MTKKELKTMLQKAASTKQSVNQFLDELSSMSNESFEELVFDIFDPSFSPNGKHSLTPQYINDGTDQAHLYFTLNAKPIPFSNNFNYNRLGLTFEFILEIKCYDANTNEVIMSGELNGKYNMKQEKVKLNNDVYFYARVPMHEDDYGKIPSLITQTIAHNLHTDYSERAKLVIPVHF